MKVIYDSENLDLIWDDPVKFAMFIESALSLNDDDFGGDISKVDWNYIKDNWKWINKDTTGIYKLLDDDDDDSLENLSNDFLKIFGYNGPVEITDINLSKKDESILLTIELEAPYKLIDEYLLSDLERGYEIFSELKNYDEVRKTVEDFDGEEDETLSINLVYSTGDFFILNPTDADEL